MSGHFEKALQDGEAYEVLMNEVLFVSFVPGSECRSIGTANLNSCTSAMVVSQHGAILAHIAPRPDNASKDDLLGGVRHVTQKMDDFGTLYQQRQQFFPKEKPSWIVSAIFQGEIALPDFQLRQTRDPTTKRVLKVEDGEPQRLVLRWMTELSDAAAWLESLGYAHGNIRPPNLLFDRGDHLKLNEFHNTAAVGTAFDVGIAPYARVLGDEGRE